ncbi:hypothetical protein CSC3H3_15155 [Thalassospira marina]|uniref:HTH cro/C1-type domain-containing protein n=2 Tax=Thalassospira marina TaxID=2048283 RepID=A0ABM6QBR0_9PROT|nr:hypothetical protein CSC3H3_15155 [Thalassospira marina]
MPKMEHEKKDGKQVPAYNIELGTRISSVIRQFKSLKEAASHAGVTDETLAAWRDGKTEPKFIGLQKLAVAAGVSLDWLASGIETLPEQTTQSRKDTDTVLVPHYDARLAAGDGALNGRSNIIGYVPFSRDFFHKKLAGINPDRLIILDVAGDSMEPTVSDGDQVLIDTKQKELTDGIMAFILGETAHIKRLRLFFDGLEVISDNRSLYPSQQVTREQMSNVKIIGRALWVGRFLVR